MEKQRKCHVKIETEDVTEAFDTLATESLNGVSFTSAKGEDHQLTAFEGAWRYQKWGESYLDFTFSNHPSEGIYRTGGHTLILSVNTVKFERNAQGIHIVYQLLDQEDIISTHRISIDYKNVQEA